MLLSSVLPTGGRAALLVVLSHASLVVLVCAGCGPVNGDSGLPVGREVGEFSSDDRSAFCEWWEVTLGGEGVLDCPEAGRSLVVRRMACADGFAVFSASCSWSVGVLEDCTYATQSDACAAFLDPACIPPDDCF